VTESDSPRELPWKHPGWVEATEAWTRRELGRLGRRATGPFVFVHQRPWSALARIDTDQGRVYFKAPAPALAYEARITERLAALRPGWVVRPLAVDPADGWMLLPHFGETLRSRIRTPADLRQWTPILQGYADLQREAAGSLPTFLALGAPDRRLESLPAQFDALLDDGEALRLGRPGGLSQDEHRRLRALRPTLVEDCERLASFGLPETIVHEEIHDANVLFSRGQSRLIDWGDSSLGHPFVSLLVLLRHPAYRLEIAESDPAVQSLRTTFLEAWSDFGGPDDLRRAAAIAYRLAMVVRSLAYQAALGPLPETYRIEIDNTAGWLQDYLAAQPAA
jgi:hypothetical protein